LLSVIRRYGDGRTGEPAIIDAPADTTSIG
jgi:hypothetical protein